jgi:endonuclease/exonuclease/phosphatase family metal-dependent hydrolase
MRLATYNFQLGGRRDGARHWQRLEAELEPDIIFAQEANRPPGHSPRARGGRTVWRRISERAWGSAIVVRGRVIEELTFEAHSGWLAGCVAELEDGFVVSAVSLHAPMVQGQNYAALLSGVVGQISRLQLDAPLVLGGDFNVKSAGPRAVTEEITPNVADQAIMARVSAELGLVSCWEAAHPGVDLPQTLRWSRSPEVPYHSDAIFVDARWKVRSCEVVRDGHWPAMSDHFPVVADVQPPVEKRAPARASRARS